MLSDDATITELRDTAEDFTWEGDYVKTNAEQLRTLGNEQLSSQIAVKEGACIGEAGEL